MLNQSANSKNTMPATTSRNHRMKTVLEEVFDNWDRGVRPDARQAIEANPEFAEVESFAIELAYVEYQRRCRAGEAVEVAGFCGQFPSIEEALRQVLELNALLSDESDAREQKTRIAWPEIGETLSDFEIISELGRGAFSRVFLARQISLRGRLVALKASFGELFEAETIARLEHPNIVSVHSVHLPEDSAISLICMPFQGRATLANVLEILENDVNRRSDGVFADVARQSVQDGEWNVTEAPVSAKGRTYVDAVFELGAALAGALQHAHDRDVLHLDLKPTNVLLSFQGAPLILDFNLAADLQRDRPRTGGTLPYMAPEALECFGHQDEAMRLVLDGRADVFSLGVMLYQLLSLRLPFKPDRDGVPLSEAALRHRRKIELGCISIRRLVPEIDAETASLIDRCLSADPKLRPSCEQLASALQSGLAPTARLVRAILRRRRLAFAAGFTFLTLIGGSIGIYLNREPLEQEALAAARAAMQRNDWPRAVSQLNAALELRPEFCEAYLERGEAYARNNQLPQALDDFRAANRIRLTRDGVAAQCCLAAQLNSFEEAVASGKTYLKEFGTQAAVLNNLGYAESKLKQYRDAEATLSEAARLEDAPLAVYFNRAAIVTQRALNTPSQSLDPAISDMRLVVATSPDAGEPYLQLAFLLAQRAKQQGAQDMEVEPLLEAALKRGMSLDFVKSIAPLTPYVSQSRLAKVAADHGDNRSQFLFKRVVAPW